MFLTSTITVYHTNRSLRPMYELYASDSPQCWIRTSQARDSEPNLEDSSHCGSVASLSKNLRIPSMPLPTEIWWHSKRVWNQYPLKTSRILCQTSWCLYLSPEAYALCERVEMLPIAFKILLGLMVPRLGTREQRAWTVCTPDAGAPPWPRTWE